MDIYAGTELHILLSVVSALCIALLGSIVSRLLRTTSWEPWSKAILFWPIRLAMGVAAIFVGLLLFYVVYFALLVVFDS